jgi:CheY-like chemotaxis protein
MTADAPRGGRVFIVDDDPNIVQMLADILSDEGFEVATATRSLSAVDRIRSCEPDLPEVILMNYQMPYVDGIELCQQLSQDEVLRDIPIILVSVKASQLVVSRYFELATSGMVDYLNVPFEVEELLGAVRRVMAYSGRRRERRS